ncbi:MAG: hypothetical protein FWH06_02485 [Oscillospiraceae bacterium]|nr:hypothetical protein [Oscillospiraceae bacterium]
MVFIIGGTDYAKYIEKGGLRWSRNDLDDAYAGRTIDGVMHRRRVAVKRKLTVRLTDWLPQAAMSAICAAIAPERVDVTFIDPQLGQMTRPFYGSCVEAAAQISVGGEVFWSGGVFSLIEV